MSKNYLVKATVVSLSGITTTQASRKCQNKLTGKDNCVDNQDVKAFASFSTDDAHTNLQSRPLPQSTSGKRVAVWDDDIDEKDKEVSGPSIHESNNDSQQHTKISDSSTHSELPSTLGAASVFFQITLTNEDGDHVEEMNDKKSPTELSPELVNINIGLTKGEETLHLGVATFVITGQEFVDHIVDVPMQRRKAAQINTAANTNNATLSNGLRSKSPPKVERSPLPSKKGIKHLFKFKGAKESSLPKIVCFKSCSQVYGVAPNATLRLKLDVISVETVNQKSAPDLPKVDASHSFSTVILPSSGQNGLLVDNKFSNVNTPELESDTSREVDIFTSLDDSIEVIVNESMERSTGSPTGLPINSTTNEDFSLINGSRPLLTQGTWGEKNETNVQRVFSYENASVHTNFEVSTINVKSPVRRKSPRKAKKKKASKEVRHNLLESLTQGSFCGMMADLDIVESDYSDSVYESFDASLDQEGEQDYNGKDKRSGSSHSVIVSDEDQDENDNTFIPSIRSGSGDLSSYNDDGSVGLETLESLNNAKMTLRRYADRVGVDVEDLLLKKPTKENGDRTYGSIRSFGSLGSTIKSGTIANTKCDDTYTHTVDYEDNTYNETTVDGDEYTIDNSTIATRSSDDETEVESRKHRP